MGQWEANGASDEWYTPKYIFNALQCVFDLDVAHPASNLTEVPCRDLISEGSLTKPWKGFIWLNPPFGGRNSLVPWLDKFFQHGNGIALTPDRTSAPWFQDNWAKADAVMFLPKVKFVRPDGSPGKSPANGTALWAVGELASAALLRAEQAGIGFMAFPTTPTDER